jgi:CRISPR-associated protein (TIGR02710 family)
VLVLNVGKPSDGEIAERPEAYALRQARPDYVVFVCSAKGADRAGTQEFVRRYADHAKLSPDRYEELLLDDPDDLVRVYEQACERLRRLRKDWPQALFLVDYTAGTKSMSAALAMAVIDQDERVELRLVKGQRGQYATVIPGTESFRPVSGIHDLRVRRWLGPLRAALDRYDYAAALQWLDALLEREISSALADQLQRARDLYRAFDAWDRWDLERAERLLKAHRTVPAGEQLAYERLTVLEQLRIVRDAFEDRAVLTEERDPYVAVDDLLLNAERRAAQARYDDATARVYRAIELLAQIRLRVAHGLVTEDVDLARVPEECRAKLAARRDGEKAVKVGLLSAWCLLAAYPSDPLGRWFRERESRVIDWVKRRNRSILAHGLRPIGETVWEPEGRVGLDLCREALDRLAQAKQRRKRLRHVQFPRGELLTGLT